MDTYHPDTICKSQGKSKLGKTRPPYPDEFREEAVRLARSSDRARTQIARELGVSDPTLSHWLKQADIDEGRAEGLTTSEREELQRLRRENRILRQERAILKKAVTFFVREGDPK